LYSIVLQIAKRSLSDPRFTPEQYGRFSFDIRNKHASLAITFVRGYNETDESQKQRTGA
jgi:hypothetical protein